jgi:hypothetical protein
MTSQRSCWHCGSDHITELSWRDLVPSIPNIDEILLYDGEKAIPRTLTFCESCGVWLASSSARKQADELIAALRLLAAVPELAGSRLEHTDRPDIRVHLGGRTYGLEITRIARGGDDAISRAQWRRAVERAARLLWRERNNQPVWVSLRWNPDPPRADVQTIARGLVDLVVQHLAVVPRKIHDSTDIGWHQIPDELASRVHGLHILHTRRDDHWVSGFALNPDVQPDELQEEITKKAQKANGYTPSGGGLWLLIYAEPSNAAQALDLTAEATAASYSGPFNRVFFLDCMDRAADLRLR